MREIIRQTQFKTDFKRIARSGRYKLADLLTVVDDLANDRRLAEKHRDHALSGTSVKAKPRLSKVALLRKALSMPAMGTLYKTAWGKRFKERLALSGKLAKLIISWRLT